MLQLRTQDSLSGGDYQWLKTKHHFPVDEQGNPAHEQLGCLVVWNDDEIAPHTGFAMHRHHDMEIITYVREGTVRHEDDSGGRGEITAGNVQAISAGRGIRHSEYNPGDDTLKIFQIWLLPRLQGIDPRWATKPFPKDDRAGNLVTLASGIEEDRNALPIAADARVLGATLKVGHRIDYRISKTRYGYLVSTRGGVIVNGHHLKPRDGIAIKDETLISIEAADDAEIVFVDAG